MIAWAQIQLRHLFDIYSGSTPESGKAFYWDGDIPWVTPEDISQLESGYHLYDTRRKITDEGYEKTGVTIVPENSIVLTKRAPIGLLAILGIKSCSNQGCFLLVSKRNVSQEFYYYFLFASKSKLQLLGRGSTFMELNLDDIKTFKVPFPNREIQNNIAGFLNKEITNLDNLISAKKTQLNLLSEKRQAIITKALTKGLNLAVKKRDSGIEWIGEIPIHWKIKRLKFCLKDKLKYGANASGELYNSSWYRYIRITDFTAFGTLDENNKLSLPPELGKEFKLYNGDILFARSGATVGKSFQFISDDSTEEYCYAGYLIKATPNQEIIISDFLYNYTISCVFDNWKNSVFIKATIENISADKYANLWVTVPPINEQKEIVEYIKQETEKIDKLKEATQKSIELLKERRTALIFEAVTGQLEIY